MVRYGTIVWLLLAPLLAGGQALEFGAVEKLPANVNSEYEESMPLLSPDGMTLYFTRFMSPENTGGKFTGTDVWASRYDVTTFGWGKADNKSVSVNSTENNAVIGMNSKGDVLYTMNTSGSRRVNGIYFSKRFNGGWSRPELIPIDGINTQAYLSMYVSPDLDVVFLSMKGDDSHGEEDLYVSVKNAAGQWSKPKNLGPSVNTGGFEISPYLSQDKKRLFFSSNGFGGEGDGDIYYSDRLYTSSWETWSAPRNLGNKINTRAFEAYFALYGDSVAYFTSNRGGKLGDIYKAEVLRGSADLGFRQRYLTKEETDALLGAGVSRKVTFSKGKTELDGPQKELLFYIANKVIPRKEVNVRLAVLEEDTPENTAKRIQAVADHLKLAGVESFRLLLPGTNYIRKKSDSGGVIELQMFQ